MAWLKNLKTQKPIPASQIKWADDNSDTRSVADVINSISQATVDAFYPVGSIYMSVNSTNPSTLFAGTTWTQLKDRFLLGAGDTYGAGTTGGEATHKLTEAELPQHSHSTSSTKKSTNISAGSGYTVAVANDYGPTFDYKTGNTGGNGSHNNMPPYLAVYMWKRIS